MFQAVENICDPLLSYLSLANEELEVKTKILLQ